MKNANSVSISFDMINFVIIWRELEISVVIKNLAKNACLLSLEGIISSINSAKDIYLILTVSVIPAWLQLSQWLVKNTLTFRE